MFNDIDTGMGASIDLKGVTYTSQDGKLDILKDLNVSIESGARVVITGPNGSGKSTLLRLLSAQYEATSGTVSYNGQTAVT